MAKNKLTDEQLKQLISDLRRDKPTDQDLDGDILKDDIQDMGTVSRVKDNLNNQVLEAQAKKRLNADNHKQQQSVINRLKLTLVISIVLTIPIILLSKPIGLTLPFTLQNIPYQTWIVLGLSTLIYVYGGLPFIKAAWREVKSKQPSTMLLSTIGLTLTYMYSTYLTVINYIHPSGFIGEYFLGLAVLVDIMLVGQIFEKQTLIKVGTTTEDLAKLLPQQVQRVGDNGEIDTVAITDLQVGDYLRIQSGATIPTDGIIIAGETTVNESMLTGEVNQVVKQVDDVVIGGSINDIGTITIKVTHLENDSFIAKMQAMLIQAQAQKSSVQIQAAKIEKYVFYLTMILAISVLIFGTLYTGIFNALPLAVSVLVIASPHTVRLVIPIITDRLMTLAAHSGLLVQHLQPLSKVPNLKYALMDKTGTLTEGNFKIRTLKSISDEYSDSDILAIMATLENGSTHPLAQGIITMAKNKKVGLMRGSEIENQPGVGVTGVINNQRFALVAIDYLIENGITFDQNYFDKLADAGNSVSFLVTTNKVVGIVAQGDVVKSSAIKFIRELKKLGITPVMLTGDNPVMAKRVAQSLAIPEVKAQLKPDAKAQLVCEYQQAGAVMMIGDGVNDSLALAQADLGIAIGAGTDIAIQAADIVSVNDNPIDILQLLTLVKAANNKIKRNFWWVITYNIGALLLAIGILIPFGLKINPMIGVILATILTMIVTGTAAQIKVKDTK
ncbi:heavy metal translocating P-type ATPase [Periweissella fabalis]|uniref:P-type Cu(+) transporter n=1 Tax=Periweissella fabalis TaxID=1070421 RepID=A0A7X6S275_9LACO|nr:heavy metal translocating P-type ATPase [Periweissella fabalis]MCM0599485.1 heavy metal translocating P-type ATPase [Periweissella fabalis]NKZ23764.1 heavy metal translocating P-type ATPase [Periweissella fabalis]